MTDFISRVSDLAQGASSASSPSSPASKDLWVPGEGCLEMERQMEQDIRDLYEQTLDASESLADVLKSKDEAAFIRGLAEFIKMPWSELSGSAFPRADRDDVHYDLSFIDLSVSLGLPSALEALLKAGADPRGRRAQDYGHDHAIHRVARTIKPGKVKCAELLLAAGVDVESQNGSNQSPLSICAQTDYEEIASLLLDKGALVDENGDEGESPLWFAAREGSESVAALLIARGARIEGKDTNAGSPLWVAAQWGHEEVVALLLSQGADEKRLGPGGKTPEEAAIQAGELGAAGVIRSWVEANELRQETSSVSESVGEELAQRGAGRLGRPRV